MHFLSFPLSPLKTLPTFQVEEIIKPRSHSDISDDLPPRKQALNHDIAPKTAIDES
jgi:hypothetical protein